MKFTICLVMFALLADCAYSSLVPLSYTAVHGPTLLAASPGLVYAHPQVVTYHAAPATYAVHAAPAPVVVAAPLVAAEGTYIAQTKGAIHVAPLPGHANSASSINLESAPGTI